MTTSRSRSRRPTSARSSKGRTPTKETRRLLPVLRDLEIDHVSSARLNGARVDASLVDAITSIEREITIDGANLLTLSLNDPEREILRSPLALGRVDLDLGAAGRWRLHRQRDVGGLQIEGDQTTLRLWCAASAALRATPGPLRKSSDRLDLAAFCNLLARGVRDEVALRVVAPYPGETPPDETHSEKFSRTTRTRSSSSSAGPAGGFSASDRSKLTSKGVRATPSQVRIIDGILDTASKLGASRRVLIACVMASTGESNNTNVRHGDAARNDTIGIFQQGPEWVAPSKTGNPVTTTRAFLTKPGRGWKASHGSLTNGRGNLSQMIHKVQDNADPRYYQQFEREATHTVDLWLDGRASRTHGGPVTRTTTGTRNVDRPAQWRVSSKESYWTALEREAKRLGRRRYIAMPWSTTPRLVVARDQQLILAQPHLTLDGLDDVLLTQPPSIELEGAKRLQTIELSVIADAWSAPPGGVVDIVETGPADGPWIVQKIVNPSGSPVAQVTLQQPTTTVEARENNTSAASSKTVVGGGRGSRSSRRTSAVDRVYSEALAISKEGKPYGAAGHVASWASARRAPNQDCSSSTSLALKAGGLIKTGAPQVSDYFLRWGQPGRGSKLTVWVKRGSGSAGHVWIQFHHRPGYRRFDTSQNGSRGARVVSSERSTAGFVPRHWPGL